jgi:predicted transcriptional regulator
MKHNPRSRAGRKKAKTVLRLPDLEYAAHRHRQDPATALDEVLREALEWERQDYREAVKGIRNGYADLKAGRVRPIDEAFDELREKHGIPR